MTRLFAVLLIPLLLSSALATEDDLDHARLLREQASGNWNAGLYAEAVKKLRLADSILEKLAGDHSADRAITLRMLCESLMKAGEHEENRAVWIKLCHLMAGRKEQWQEVWVAYVAVMQSSWTFPTIDEAIEYIEPVRRAAIDQVYPKIAAQALHDLAYRASALGEQERGVPLLEKAIEERRRIRDLTGLTWSLNNLANSLIHLGRIEEALGPVEEAWSLVHEKGQVAPQWNVEHRIQDLLAAVEKSGEVGKKTRRWLWETGFRVAAGSGPYVVPADRILRTAMAVDPDPRMLDRVVRTTLGASPPEVSADLTIRAARAAGFGPKAARWLARVDCGDGPASPHLRARLATARALALAAKEDGKGFPAKAREAAAAWRDLGDRHGRETALGELARAAKDLGVEADLADLLKESEDLARFGSPGGAGSSASSGGDRSGYQDLGPHAPLFRISLVEGKIEVRDLLADRRSAVPVEWKPRDIGLNGVSFRFFGGYVTITSFDYGGGASAPGSPGRIALDELGAYLPVPAKGGIVVVRNGAIRYDL